MPASSRGSRECSSIHVSCFASSASRRRDGGGKPYRISDLELASRLSFFLWSSIPDDQLLDVAVAGKLHEPAVLEQQTRRMLADSKARALVTNFGGQWLYLRELKNARPETTGFSENLRQSLRRETEMLLESIVREDRSVIDLLNADYTFVDETLARHYGIPSVRGSRFRRVAVTDEARRGLLGHGSFLLVTSVANRTSPVSRGKWVLENLLGVAPPLPPPNVPAIDESRKPPRHRRCVRRWRSIAGTRRAPRATGSWTRSASRSRTSTWSDDGGRDGNAPIDAPPASCSTAHRWTVRSACGTRCSRARMCSCERPPRS